MEKHGNVKPINFLIYDTKHYLSVIQRGFN